MLGRHTAFARFASLDFPSHSENRLAGAAFLVFFLAWAVAQAVLNADRTLHYDLTEAVAWGQEFQLGYNQHGPFWAWIAGAWFLVFPNTNTSFVFLEALNATLGLFGAWMLIGLFTKGWQRHAATLFLVATPFYTFNAYKYNANTIFISLWPWTLYFFVRSIDGLRKRDALLFGCLAAFCILSKYYAALLLASCGLSLIVHPNARGYLLSSLPLIAAGVFVLIVSPHVVWVLTSDAPPVAYAMSLTGRSLAFTGGHIAKFVLDLILFQAVMALLVYLSSSGALRGKLARYFRRIGRTRPFMRLVLFIRGKLVWLRAVREGELAACSDDLLPTWRLRFLGIVTLVPVGLTLIAASIFRLKIDAIMAIGIFPLMSFFLMQLFAPLDKRRCLALAMGCAVVLTVLAIPGSLVARALETSGKAGPSLTFPYRELAESATELWHAETHTPLRFVGGDSSISDGVAFYSPDRPSSFIKLDYRRALWITPQKLKNGGLLIICIQDDEACLSKAETLLEGHWKKMSLRIGRIVQGKKMPEVTFDLFLIPSGEA